MFEDREQREGAGHDVPAGLAASRLTAVLTRPRPPAPEVLVRLLAAPREADDARTVHPAVAALQDAASACRAASQDLHGAVDVVALARLAESVQGLALRSLAGFDRAGGYAVGSPELGTHAHASAAAFLHQTVGLAQGDGRGRVRLAARLAPSGDLAPLGERLVSGRTTVAHCRAVADGVRGLDPEVVAGALPAIVELTGLLDPVALARELRERAHAVSDDLAREQERRQRERRGFWLSRSSDGVGHAKGLLPALESDLLEEALERVARRQRTALDEAGQRDTRDAGQRRADALVELARHALAADSVDVTTSAGTASGPLVGAGGVRAAVTVLVTAERLAGQPGAAPVRTASGTVLSTGTLLALTCDAEVSRLVLGTAGDGSSVVLDLGRQTRTVTPGQWRALVGRDRTCVVRGCSRPPSHCQAHHVRHWARGGASDLENYALVCAQHHAEIHADESVWHRHRDGRWLTPDGHRPASADPPTASRYRYPDPGAAPDPSAPF